MQSKLLFRLIIFLFFIKSFSTVNYEESDKYETISKCDDRQLPRKRIVCFYRVEDEFRPYDVDPCLCTHLIYSYVAVRENFAFVAGKKGDLKFLTALKQQNPGLKILVSLRPSNNQFILEESERSNSTSLAVRTKFAKRVREFVRRHGLDGVDLDWEYFKEAHNHVTKRETLLSVLNVLNNELKPLNETSENSHNFLTITTSKYGRDLTDYYDFSEIYRFVDFVNVPAFNFDSNPKAVIHPSRLHGLSDMENMDSIIDLVLALGLPQEQLVVGVPAHGILYKLLNASLTEPGSPASSWNNEEVIITHSKICAVRDNSNWTLVRDKDLTAPYIYFKDKWIGFDDEISIKLKAKYVVLRQLSGLAIWSLNDDDYSGNCGYGPFPLLQSVRSVFLKPIENINNRKIDSYLQNNDLSDSTFVAVIEKYGNVEKITDSESDESQLSCSNSGYIRHPNDCSKFYRCIHFNKNDESPEIFQYNCPIGLVFDDRYEMCNWPSWSPSCLGSGEIVTTPKKQFVCPTYGYFQDPQNCEFFYYCSDFGKSYLQSYQMKCPFDLAFDEEKLLCNWKWLVKGCPPVDPADQVIRDLPHLLNQNTGSDESSDKLQERSDYTDMDQSFSSYNSDNTNQNTSPDPDRKGGSRFRRITQYMTKFVGDLGNRLKSMFSTKIDSRSDTHGNRWLSRMNIMPKFNKNRPTNQIPNHNTNKRISGISRIPYINDPLISIPMLEIRPDSQYLRNRPIKGKPNSQRKIPFNSIPVPKQNRHPINHLSLSGLQDPNDMFQLSSITKTVQKLQEIIPLKNSKSKSRGKDSSREPIAHSSNIKETKVSPLSSSTISANPPRRPQKNSVKNKIRSKFHFPTTEPLVIETMEEFELPHYLPQQLSKQHIPRKKSNLRTQQQNRYLGALNHQKEVLHFKPEDLNLESIKIDTKRPQLSPEKDDERQKQPKHKYVNNNRNPIQNPIEINFQNIDTKLLDSMQYSLKANDNKNDFQTIHLANNPNKEIKVNVNKDSNPSLNVKQNSGPEIGPKGPNSQNKQKPRMPEMLKLPSDAIKVPDLSKFPTHFTDVQFPNQKQSQQKPTEKARIPDSPPKSGHQNERQRDQIPHHSKSKPNPQLPIHPGIHLGSSIQYLNHFLPNNMEFLQKHIYKPPVPQIKPERVPQHDGHRNVGRHQTPIETKPHSMVRPKMPQIPELDLRPVFNIPEIPEFEAKKIVNNKQKQNKPSTRIPPPPPPPSYQPNQQDTLHLTNDRHNQRQKELDDQRIANNPYSDHKFKANVEHLDTSASISEHFATYNVPKQYERPSNNKYNSNKISSTQDIINKNKMKSPQGLMNNYKEPEKSQLLIVPVDDYSDPHKYHNLEIISKEHPKQFSEDLIVDNKHNIHSEHKTTSRPRVIFTAPASASTLGPSMSDEYIMLMLNNEQNLLNNSDGQKSIQEIFKKTDGKLYNLETESSRTLVALVPKTPTSPKPMMYEPIQNLVSFNVTQPPVVIKFEIPRPKSEVFQSIVHKVRQEWLSEPYSQSSYSTLPPYQVIRHEYQNPRYESSTAQPYIPVTYRTTTTTTQTPIDIPNQPFLPSIYDSLQQILAQNQWSLPPAPSTPSVQTTETTSVPITTTQSSVILEHIPLYDGYNNNNNNNNHTNGMSWHQNAGIPWYQQVISYPAPVNPYPPMPAYPQMPMGANYPYYPMQTGYGYRAPPNIQQPHHGFQPQYLTPNLTANNWYDFYGNDQTTVETTTPTTTSTTTTTTTTTPSTTTETIVSSAATQRSVPKTRNRPSFARRTSTTRKPKTTTEEKFEVSTQNSIDIQRANNNREKQKIEVIIVDEYKPEQTFTDKPYRQPDISDQTDIKVVYMDGSKDDAKQTHNSNVSPKGETSERYGLRNGVKPTNHNQEDDRIEAMFDSEPINNEPLPTLSETTYPKVEHQLNKDIEYEDEPEVGSIVNEEIRSTTLSPAAKAQSPQSVYNSNSYPGIRNITENAVPESACTRPGLFQHPFDCNKYYECYWDKYINKFTIHSFECPVKLAFDSRIVGCGLPNDPTICVQY